MTTGAQDDHQKTAGKLWGKLWDCIKPLLFVLAAFVLWFLFALSAQKVITCVPSGCSLIAWPDSEGLGTRERLIVMSITLAIALWVSGKIFFSEE